LCKIFCIWAVLTLMNFPVCNWVSKLRYESIEDLLSPQLLADNIGKQHSHIFRKSLRKSISSFSAPQNISLCFLTRALRT
jgi:hypothetical protein